MADVFVSAGAEVHDTQKDNATLVTALKRSYPPFHQVYVILLFITRTSCEGYAELL